MKDTMQIDKEIAKRLYPDAPDWLKEQLEQVFGKDFLAKFDFRSIKTFEDAYQKLGIFPLSVFSLEDDTPDEIAYKKLKVMAKAINDGWMPDYSKPYQNKWFPVFYYGSTAGLVFSYSLSAASSTSAFIGSRLCFETKEKADYAGQQFLDLYKDFIT